MAIGYIRKKCEGGVETLVPETTAGPSAGTVRKLSFDCNIDYAVPITQNETGEGYVGISGCCSLSFNPTTGTLTADKFCGEASSTDMATCVEITPTCQNLNYKVPFTCCCELYEACSQNILYNPNTGALTTNCICASNEIEAACEIRAGEFCSRTANKGITAATTSEGNTVNHNGGIIYKGCDGELATSGCCQFTYNPSTGTLCVNHVVAIDDVTKTICCTFTNASNETITSCVSANGGYLHTLVNCSDGNVSLGRYCECITPSSKCVSTSGSINSCIFGIRANNVTCETNSLFRKDICSISYNHLTRMNVDTTGVNIVSQDVASLTCACLDINIDCSVLLNVRNTAAGWRCPRIGLDVGESYGIASLSNKLVNSTTGDDIYNAGVHVSACKVIGYVGDSSEDIGNFLLDCDGVFKVSNSCTSNNYARVLTECDACNICMLKNPSCSRYCLCYTGADALNLYGNTNQLWLNYAGGVGTVKIGDGSGGLGSLCAGTLVAGCNTVNPSICVVKGDIAVCTTHAYIAGYSTTAGYGYNGGIYLGKLNDNVDGWWGQVQIGYYDAEHTNTRYCPRISFYRADRGICMHDSVKIASGKVLCTQTICFY